MLEQIERQETQEQLIVPRLEIAIPVPVVENDQRQRRRMVVALVLLLVALGLVLVKDRDFWFPASEVADSEEVDDSSPAATASDNSVPAAAAVANANPGAALRSSKRRGRPAPPAPPTKSLVPEASASPVVPAARVELAPLRVEVVAGDRHQMVRPGSPAVAVELQNGASGRAASEPVPPRTEVASSVPPANVLTHPVRPEYPLLARQMKVQGAVELHAQIGKDGGVQTLQVVGGPEILADAAREAVKQWRFKPYFKNGEPVETQVPITVNFTIQTGK